MLFAHKYSQIRIIQGVSIKNEIAFLCHRERSELFSRDRSCMNLDDKTSTL